MTTDTATTDLPGIHAGHGVSVTHRDLTTGIETFIGLVWQYGAIYIAQETGPDVVQGDVETTTTQEDAVQWLRERFTARTAAQQNAATGNHGAHEEHPLTIDERTADASASNQPRRGYIHSNAAWYADATLGPNHPGEMLFGLYYPDGGTTGEMSLEWRMLQDRTVPALHVYDDGWGVLFGFADVLEALADHANQHIGPAQFCAILDGLGFTDMTERARPAGR